MVRRMEGQSGFAVQPRRRVVERSFAWLLRWRRLVRDYEQRIDVSQSWYPESTANLNTMGFFRIPDMISKPSNPFNSFIVMTQFSGIMQIAASHIYGKESVLLNYTYDDSAAHFTS